MTDFFSECRERITAQEVAQRFGVTIDRHGRALCPFHNDHNPSMSFRSGRFHCWSCGASGDSIDFTARFLGLEPLAAVERLNVEFTLGLPLHREPTAQERAEMQRRREIAQAHQAFEEWKAAFILKLCRVCLAGNQLLAQGKSMEQWADSEVFIIRNLEYFTYLVERLENGSPEDQIQIFKDREGVQAWIGQALKTPLTPAC